MAGAVGLLVGVLLNRLNVDNGVYEALAATLGAAIAVLGALIVAEHRESAARRELRRIIGASVSKLKAAAAGMEEVSVRLEDSARVESIDWTLKQAIQKANAALLHLLLFSPYDRLGDYEVVSSIADIELEARALAPMLDEPYDSGGGTPMDRMRSTIVMSLQRTAIRSQEQVEQVGRNIRQTCDKALELLDARH